MIRQIKKTISFKAKSLTIHLQSISDKKRLKKLGFRKVEFLTWSPKYLRKYYSAFSNGNMYFVKITNNDSASLNEIYVLEKLSLYDFSFIPSIKYLSKDFHKKSLLVTSYSKGTKFINAIKNETSFDAFCFNAIQILNAFYQIGFVHGDIHEGNLLVSENGFIELIDFGIGTFVGGEQKTDYKTHFGTYYKIIKDKNRTIRRYDDAYSFVEFIKTCNVSAEWLNNQSYKELESLTGRLFFDVAIDNI